MYICAHDIQTRDMETERHLAEMERKRGEREREMEGRHGDWVIDRPGPGDSCCSESLSD